MRFPRNTKLAAAVLSLAAVGSWAAAATDDAALSLNECVARALKWSPAVTAGQHDLLAAKAGVKKERSALLPSVTANLTGETVSGLPVTPFSVANVPTEDNAPSHTTVSTTTSTRTTAFSAVNDKGKRSSSTTAVVAAGRTVTTSTSTVNSPRSINNLFGLAQGVITYPLFDKGSILGLNNAPTVAYAKAMIEQQTWENNMTHDEVVNGVSAAFLTALWSGKEAGYDSELLELLKRRVEVVQQEVDLDLRLPSDLVAAKTQVAAETDHHSASQSLTGEARAHLAHLIHFAKPGRLRLLAPKTSATLPDLSELLGRSTSIHPQLGLQTAIIEGARQQYRLNRSALWPTVNFNQIFAHTDDFRDPGHDQAVSALQVGVPLFDFGERMDATRQASERVAAEEARLDKVKDEIFNQVTGIYSAIHTLQFAISDLEIAIAQAEAALKLLESQQELGMVREDAVLDARIALVSRWEMLDETRFRQQLEYAALQKASGGSWKWTP